MKLTNEFQPIRDWRTSRGLNTNGNIPKQIEKLEEEFQELKDALLSDDQNEVEDAIGDMSVVLTGIAELKNCKIEDCINGSYNIISKRTGIMINGTFVKNDDIYYVDMDAENINGNKGPYDLVTHLSIIIQNNNYIVFRNNKKVILSLKYDSRHLSDLFINSIHPTIGKEFIIFKKDVEDLKKKYDL